VLWSFPLPLHPLTSPKDPDSEAAAYITASHPDYAILAARIAIYNLHKATKKKLSGVIGDLYTHGESCIVFGRVDVCRSP